MRHLSAPSSSRQQCEPLFELFTGAHGRLYTGQMLKGTDAGRVVTLRELSGPHEHLAPAVDLARSLAHPQLSKVLGIVHGDAKVYIASEYTPGVSLLELGNAVRKQQTRLSVAAAVRVLLDAAKATAAAQQLLRQTANLGYTRALFSDTVWIAEYGEVLLTEIGLAPLLGVTHAPSSEADAMARDVLTAGVEIFQLCSGQPMSLEIASQLTSLPPPLAQLLERVLTQPYSFDGPANLANALEDLPADLRGDERQVAEELERVMRSTLETRKHTLNAVRQFSSHALDDDVTHFSRPSGVIASIIRETTRPPTQPDSAGAAAPAPGLDLEWEGPLQTSAEGDDVTTIFRAPAAHSTVSPLEPVEGRAAVDAGGDLLEDATRIERVEFLSMPPEEAEAPATANTFDPNRSQLSRWLVLFAAAAIALALLDRCVGLF